MELDTAIRGRRSIRRFMQKPVEKDKILELIEAARFAPSGANAQRLRYIVVQNPATSKEIFLHTKWANYVRPRRTPEWGVSAPTTFIALTVSTSSPGHIMADAGAAIQNILLKAFSIGLGCCWIGSFNIEKTSRALGLDRGCKLLFLLAVGYPAESPVCEELPAGNDTKYYLDTKDVLHVPKLNSAALVNWI